MTPFALKNPYYFLDVLNLIPLLTSFHCILLKDRRAAQLCRMVLMASLCRNKVFVLVFSDGKRKKKAFRLPVLQLAYYSYVYKTFTIYENIS